MIKQFFLIASLLLAPTIFAQRSESYIKKGDALKKQGKLNDAHKYYTLAIKSNQRMSKAWMKRASLNYDAHHLKNALSDCNQALKLNSRSATAYNLRAMIKADSKQYTKALADYNMAIRINPKFALAYFKRGICFTNMKNYSEAINDFTTVVRIIPNGADAYRRRGVCYFQLKQYDEAEADYTAAIRYNPKYTSPFYNRAHLFSKMKKYPEAIKDYTAILQLKSKSTRAYNLRGVMYNSLKQYDKAEADFNMVIQLDPKHIDAYYNRGNTYSGMKQYSKAEADFRKVLAIKPDDYMAMERIGYLMQTWKKDPKEAMQYYNQAIKVNPRFAAAYKSRAILNQQNGNFAGAIKDINKAAALSPNTQLYQDIQKKILAESKTGGFGKTSTMKSMTAKTGANVPEWVKNLPSVPNVKPVKIYPRTDLKELTKQQYAGAVSAAKEAMLELIGPMNPSTKKSFDEKWLPMYDFPAPECLAYLSKVTPLLESALGTRMSMVENLKLYNDLWRETGYVSFYNEEAAKKLMLAVQRQATIIKSLKATLQDVMMQLEKLGSPPSPIALKEKANKRHRKAMNTLAKLLGMSLDLGGEYEEIESLTLLVDPKKKRKQYLIQKADKFNVSWVIKPLEKTKSNLVLFYQFIDFQTKTGKGFQRWRSFLAEPTDDGWVNYTYNTKNNEAQAWFYRPTEDRLTVDHYLLSKGIITTAIRKVYDRYPITQSTQEVPQGNTWKDVEKSLKKKVEKIADHEKKFFQGKQVFSNILARRALPELSSPSDLYWVMTKIDILRKFDQGLIKKDKGTSIACLDHYYEMISEKDTPTSLSVKWRHRRKFYNKNKKSGRKVFRTEDTETNTVNVNWNMPPKVIANGAYWTLKLKGKGIWKWMLGGKAKRTGLSVFTSAYTSGHIRKLGWPTGVNIFFDKMPQPGVKQKEVDRVIRSEKKSGLSCTRYVRFDSGSLITTDSNATVYYPVYAVANCGYLKVTYIYQLRTMTEDEARQLAAASKGEFVPVTRIDVSHQDKKAVKEEAKKPDKKVVNEDKKLLEEKIKFHEANIALCKREVGKLKKEMAEMRSKINSGKASKADIERYNQLAFRMTCQESNIVSESDRIKELHTGKIQHSRTPFDEMCRGQLIRNIKQELKQMDAADRKRRKAELLANKLDGHQQRKAHELINKVTADGGGINPQAWQKLNGTLQNIYQAEQQQEIAKIDEELAWHQAKIDAAENIKAGADVGMTVMSMTGGPMLINLTYQAATGTAEGGMLEGAKRAITTYSDAADIAVSTYEGWKANGFKGAAKGFGVSLLMNKGPEYALKKLRIKTGGVDGDGKVRTGDTGKAKAPDGKVKAPDGPDGPKTGDIDIPITKKPKMSGKDAIEAGQFQQEIEYGESMAEDFFDSYKRMRTAELRGNASPDELNVMRMEVRQKAAAVNNSMTAKNYLKYGATPIKGNAYSKVMDEISEDTIACFNWEMRNRGFNEQSIYHCRNASSSGAGMDIDLALKEQPNFIPVRGDDGNITYRRNNWLTKNGQPIDVSEYQCEGSQVMREAYKKVTGGYNARQSFVDLTTSVGRESYRDKTFLQLPVRGHSVDPSAANRKLDKVLGKIDPELAPHSLGITAEKAEIMFNEHPELRPLGSMMETCRGTAKDLNTKFIPLVESRIRQIEKLPKDKKTSDILRELKELQETQKYLGECMNCFNNIGQGKIPPWEWKRQFKMTTGGEDPIAVTQRLASMAGKAVNK